MAMAETKAAIEYKPIRNIGKRKHPHYVEHADLWDFLLASWKGGLGMSGRSGMTEQEARDLKVHGFYPGLYRNSRESLKDYIRRVAETPYTPIARQIVDEYARYVTKDIPKRTGAEAYKELIDNVDLTGRDMGIFVRDALSLAMVMGEIGILVDMPEVESGQPLVSAADAQARGLRAYANIVMPQNIVDWQIGRDGKYEWLIIETTELVNSIDADGATPKTTRTYYDADVWQRYENVEKSGIKTKDWVLVASNVHPCKETPVVRIVINDLDHNALTPESWFYDLADLNRAFYNVDSADYASLYYQTYALLVLPDTDSEGTVILSRAHALTENETTKGITRFEQTTGAESQSFDRKINELKMRMYMVAGLQYQAIKTAPESGISKQWDFQRVNQFLAGIAKTANAIENRISMLAAKWEGKGDGYTAIYPSDYSVRELSEIIEGVLGIKTIGFSSETGRKETIKRLYREIFPDFGEEILKLIDAEIDASVEPDPLADYDMDRQEQEETPI